MLSTVLGQWRGPSACIPRSGLFNAVVLPSLIPSALTVDWSEWAGTLGEAHGLALQKPVSHQGGWYESALQHLMVEVRWLIARGIPEPAIV